MELPDFTQLGIGGVAVGAVIFVVSKFLAAFKDFKDVLCNHIDHEREAYEKNADALKELAALIHEMHGKMKGDV